VQSVDEQDKQLLPEVLEHPPLKGRALMPKLRYAISILTAACFILACGAQHKSDHNMNHGQSQKGRANQLIHETSPYLLQHAYNPVDWYAWNDKALRKASEEDKLMIISVGYAACHWCHVMEHESFEDSVVAVKMNANYISIKVDREERPDIDQIYMNAAYMVAGRGGWPLNAIALPDGRPVYAGTYFPRERWIEVLDYFSNLYNTDRARLEEQAVKITEGIRSMDALPFNPAPPSFTMDMLDAMWKTWESKIDFREGGRQGAPKFMMPNNWDYLLRYYDLSGNARVLEAIETTLEKMAFGGLYDHVGGGFARYSTDAAWKVPHFEKMLYDNGQLVSIYAHAYQLTKNPFYEQVVRETLDYVKREMTNESGGFYSSLDADSEGVEGKFYIWTAEELKTVLGADYDLVADYYNIREEGNWEHGQNILFRTEQEEYYTNKYDIKSEALENKLAEARTQLLAEREKRIRPGLDDKILTSWNALMLKGYIDAYRAFGRQEYLESALQNAQFIRRACLRQDGGLNRNYKNGVSTINGFLDDYSLTTEAFIALYQVTFDETWLELAVQLSEYAIQHFFDDSSKMFFYTSDEDPALISRTKELADNVISSSNSSMARALYYLGMYYYKDEYLELSARMLNNVKDEVLKNGPFYANWAVLMTHFVKEPWEIAISGPDLHLIRKELDRHYLPHVLLLGSSQESGLQLLENKFIEGQTTIYVCRDKACRLPVTAVEEALELMN
jgi:uncharacterized protein YyaL (SSP411 family)